jgi:hypothetical protein
MVILIVPYLVFLGVMFYIYFGPGFFSGYRSLDWNGLRTNVPEGFNVRIYQGQGWEVYSLKKISVLIKIALRPAMDVNGLTRSYSKFLYRTSPDPDRIFYIANPRKTYEMVFAQTLGDTTVYYSVSSPSVFSAAHIMNKITVNNSYKGKPITPLKPSLPTNVYLTDFIFSGGMLLPLFIIVLVFSLSGKRPDPKYFMGDPIRYEERFVYFARVRRFSRKSSFCYLVLTETRLMVFLFGKLKWEIKLKEARGSIRIEGKKIILEKDKEKAIVRPSDIEIWKEYLYPHLL